MEDQDQSDRHKCNGRMMLRKKKHAFLFASTARNLDRIAAAPPKGVGVCHDRIR
jgi:hypothetical protein